MTEPASERLLSPFATGLACRCPRCGEGPLFQGFLKPVSKCESCGLDLSFADETEGPAVFIILIVGFVIVGAAATVEALFHPATVRPPPALDASDREPRSVSDATAQGDDDRPAIPPQGRRRPRRWLTAIPATERNRGWRLWAFVVFMLVLMGLFVGLGAWQVERLGEKERLIASVAARAGLPPIALPPVAEWGAFDPEPFGFRAVTLTGQWLPQQTVLVFTSTRSAPRRGVGPVTG